jgi:hypothetical protein
LAGLSPFFFAVSSLISLDIVSKKPKKTVKSPVPNRDTKKGISTGSKERGEEGVGEGQHTVVGGGQFSGEDR